MTYLFDIYHVQVMEGDIITRIRKFHKYIGHYHTAGVPGPQRAGRHPGDQLSADHA